MNEKGTRCRGGKQGKQRNTWAFFVNAAGEKEDPIVVGRYAKPRCFASLANNKRPYGCWYYSNNKAWMTSEVMKEVLEKLNAKLKTKGRKILLLMDSAPCHPHNLADTFSMAIKWGKQAWDEVSSDLIVKCFKKNEALPPKK